jgi:hypothetical protein
VLAAAVEAAADPLTGIWPSGARPEGGSTDPCRQVVHAVVASRRLGGWVLWAQLSMLARWVEAWRACPPVSNTAEPDRCESSDQNLTERLNVEISRVQRQVRGQWVGLASQMAPDLVAAELGLATGLSRLMSDRYVAAADAVFLHDRLPRLRRLLRAGWIEWAKLDAFVWDTECLDLVVVHAVERIILGDLEPDEYPEECLDVLADPARPGLGLPPIVTMTLPQLRAAIAAAIAAIDAEAAARRARGARAGRRVRSQANLDGTATITAELTVEAAAAVWNGLTEAAKAARAAGDPRSLDQLRADALVARATGTALPPPVPGDTWDVPDPDDTAPLGDVGTSGDPDDVARHTAHTAHAAARAAAVHHADAGEAADGEMEDGEMEDGSDPDVLADRDGLADRDMLADRDGFAGPDVGAGGVCQACGQAPSRARVGRAGRGVMVNLTLPLSSYLGLAREPGQLDGYGPVAAGLAQQIIRDTERAQRAERGDGRGGGPAGITWRCVVVDDVHGTVLGVGAPIRVPRHDPPPRLADLVRTCEPTCCFPGCRVRARDCDLDHRVPYNPADPAGERGGGATCSCTLQPLCRTHHGLKTAGLIGIRVLTGGDAGAGVVPGTLEFTTATGLRYRRAPTRATPAGPDLGDPLIATAVAHADLRAAQQAVDAARMDAEIAADQDRLEAADRNRRAAAGQPPADEYHEFDGQDRAWRRSLADYARQRLRSTAAHGARPPAANLAPPF